MTSLEISRCGLCDELLARGDAFCEACGNPVRPSPPAPGHDASDRTEQDAGIAAHVSDRGRVRAQNEDAACIGAVEGFAYAVVCDGVATSPNSRRAADAAAAAAGEVLVAAVTDTRAGGWDPETMMRRAIEQAQHAVVALSVPRGADDAASCTFVAALWDGEHVTAGSVGDSRAYWIGPTTAMRLTVDDSWAQEQVDAGLATEAEAMAAPAAHVITRWLGPDAPDAPYRVTSMRPRERGRIVVCSDGLWQYCSNASDVAELVRSWTGSAAELATHLVDVACVRGGADNVTVAVIDVAPASECASDASEVAP